VRILQITSARHFGGGERHLIDLARGLNERGHEIYVGLRPTNEWQDRLDFIPQTNILHVSIRNSFGMFSANRIGRFVERNKIDIIHAHVARDYLAASVAQRIAKRSKLVLTRHVIFPLKSFHRYALSNVDAAVGVSPPVSDRLLNIFPAAKVHTIANGLDVSPDPEAARRAAEFRFDHGISMDTPLVVTIGELKPLKGQMDLLLAAAEIVKKMPDIHFVIVGVDNTAGKRFRRDLKRLAHTLGIDGKITWLDWVEDTRPLFAAADIFVSPSHSESFGLAILEAMASGLPVVATETDGAMTLIGNEGLLVPINDPIEMGEKIFALAADQNKRTEVGDALKRRAEEQFSQTKFIDSHIELYESLLK